MDLDETRCRTIVESRDARFDGQFIHAVVSTGIYCRPSCPARTPAVRNSRFFPSSAAAQRAGFRACKRCRPDAVPGSPQWNARGDVAARAVRLIADGVVDRDGVAGLAARLAYSERQLNRVLLAELGAGPLALARAQRAQVARVLIETTDVPFTETAFAAGFASIRQFNDTVREVYGASPTELRRAAARRRHGRDAGDAGPAGGSNGALRLRLPFRPPFDADRMLRFLAARAIDGVELVDDSYHRTLLLPGGPARVRLRPGADHVECVLELRELADVPSAVARCRRMLDLDADPSAIADRLGPAAAGLRVPGTADGFELAVRAVVGQQVSVAGARSTLTKLVARHGTTRSGFGDAPARWFPTAEQLASADPASLGMPVARAAAVIDLARAVASGALTLDPGSDRDVTRAGLLALRGVGPWTADYIVMRGLGDPDVFLDTDLVVKRRLRERGMLPGDAVRWRPWRSSAVMALWAGLDLSGGTT